MNSLPKNYYNKGGLTPTINKILLTLAFLCLMTGTILLTWPVLMRFKKRLVLSQKEKRTFPYLVTGRL